MLVRLRAAVLLGTALALLGAGSASAAATWLPAGDLSSPGRDAYNPEVAMDAAGNTIALWERQSPLNPSHNIQMSSRSPGGAFSAPVDISLRSTEPDVMFTPDGEAFAIWSHFENPPGNYVIQVASRPPGAGSFSPPVTAYSAPTSVIPQDVQLAVNDAGDMIVAWTALDPNSGFEKVLCPNPNPELPPMGCPNPLFIQAAVKPAGGSFSAAVQVSRKRPPHPSPPPGETPQEKVEREEKEDEEDGAESKLTASEPRVAIDSAGNGAVVWQFFNGTEAVIQTATRPAGGSFSSLSTISAGGQNATDPELGMDSAGNAIAVWHRAEGAAVRRVEAAIRPPGGSFAPASKLSGPGVFADSPSLSVNPAGTATVAWRLSGVSSTFIQTSTRPPGGAFSAPETISSGKDEPVFPDVALGAGGDTVVVWSGDSGTNEVARAAVRPVGAPFLAPTNLSGAHPSFFRPHPAVDGAGNATVVWLRENGTHDIVQVAGYDAAPPELRNVSIPSSGVVGEALQFSATPFDVWSVQPPSFIFGDGAVATGNAVSHAYTAAGTYLVTVSTKDAAGTVTTQSGIVTIKPRGDFSLGKLKRNKKKGTATLPVTVDGPGTIVLTGKGVRKRTVRAAGPGTKNLLIKAVGKTRDRLKETGRQALTVKVTFTPDGGPAGVRQLKVRLIRTLG